MSLTDDWKAGKLKNGWYWVLSPGSVKPFPSFCFRSKFEGYDGTLNNRVSEVVASCDYEELERLKAAKSNNRYFLESIKNMTSALDYMIDENEKLQIKYNEDTDKLMRQIVNGREWEKIAKSTYPYRCDTIVGGASFITIKEENKNLRSLLKECKESIEELDLYYLSTSYENKYEDLLTRINAAIGDNEIQANPVADIKIQESEE